ncbi:MAG: M48 family metallopeptidase [Pseudomonadota bacterium]
MERICRQGTKGLNCDFAIGIDPDPKAPANAFQTLSKQGQPLIIFTQALLKRMSNIDELAFVMGHEGAHHIANHIGRQKTAARTGSILLGQIAAAVGAGGAGVAAAENIGATVGARSFSKEFELEADRLGTRITAQAGFDPLRGALFFNQIPDPGDRFLGTHPPNAARIQAVRETAASL